MSVKSGMSNMTNVNEKNSNGINNLVTHFMEINKHPNRQDFLTNLGEVFTIDKNVNIVHYVISRKSKKNSIVIMTDPKHQ